MVKEVKETVCCAVRTHFTTIGNVGYIGIILESSQPWTWRLPSWNRTLDFSVSCNPPLHCIIDSSNSELQTQSFKLRASNSELYRVLNYQILTTLSKFN